MAKGDFDAVLSIPHLCLTQLLISVGRPSLVVGIEDDSSLWAWGDWRNVCPDHLLSPFTLSLNQVPL
jgi:hypothetical protein